MAFTELSDWRTHLARPGETYEVVYHSSSGCYEPLQFKFVLKQRSVSLHALQISNDGKLIRVSLSPQRIAQLSHMVGDVMTADCADPWIVTKVFLETTEEPADTQTATNEGGLLGRITDTVTAPFRFAGEQVDRTFSLVQLALIGIILVLVILVIRGEKILGAIPKVSAG